MSAPVDNIDKYREPVDNDNEQQPVKRFSEHIVLLTIVVLSLLVGMAAMIGGHKMINAEGSGHQLYGVLFSGGSIPGAITFAFLADVYGRRPVFILLAAVSTTTSLCFLSSNAAMILMGFTLHTVSKGGVLTVTYVTVSEYCSPKHRFSYLIATISMMSIIPSILVGLLYTYVFSWDLVYVQVIMMVMGLLCLVSACLWPESPYWLAARDRRADAAWTLRRLRGAGAELELSQLQHERRSPGPRRLYWRPLLVVLITAFIVILNDLLEFATFIYFDTILDRDLVSWVLPSVCIPCLVVITVISYFIKRKILFISCCGVGITVSYVIGFWTCSDDRGRAFSVAVLISDILRTCTLRSITVVLFTEIVPYKYNMHISCVRILFMIVMTNLEMLVFMLDIRNYTYILILLIATLSSVGLGLVYWLAPETKDRTLFEIQKSQAPQYNVTCPEQNETMMENFNR